MPRETSSQPWIAFLVPEFNQTSPDNVYRDSAITSVSLTISSVLRWPVRSRPQFRYETIWEKVWYEVRTLQVIGPEKRVGPC